MVKTGLEAEVEAQVEDEKWVYLSDPTGCVRRLVVEGLGGRCGCFHEQRK